MSGVWGGRRCRAWWVSIGRQGARRADGKELDAAVWGVLLVLAVTVGWAELLSAESWRGLTVAPEKRCAPYERSDYAYRSDALEFLLIVELGGVYAPYTGRCLRSRRQTDVEHMIALSEAHDSGMCDRSMAEKVRFANDPLNLTLALPEVNRDEKRHYDAARWLPARNRCWFAGRVLEVRRKYGLTIDRAEADALEAVLSACESTDLVRHCGN